MDFDPYEAWLGVPADRRPATYYDLLGLAPYQSDPAIIEQASLRRMARVRLHQIGPHSEQSQDLLAELARARLILMDPDRRTEYDAKLRADGASQPGPSVTGQRVPIGDTEPHRDGPHEGPRELFASLALDDRPGDGPSRPRLGPHEAPSRWRRLVLGAVLMSHVALFAAFYLLVYVPSGSTQKAPALVRDDPAATPSKGKPQPPADGGHSAARLTVGQPRNDQGFDGRSGAPDAGSERKSSPSNGLSIHGMARVAVAGSEAFDTTDSAEPADPPAEAQAAQPKPAAEPRSRTEPSSARAKPGQARKSDRRRAGWPSTDPPMRVEVKPVFVVPQGEALPAREQQRRLAEHLDRCHQRYGEMLGGRDTFTIAGGPLLIHRTRSSLAELKAAFESGVPRLTAELLAATDSNRFNCPYVFVVVVVNPRDDFPVGGGRPFNGGFNTGGGVVVLSSFLLDKLPNFQSTLEHEIGHAFGLPHVDVYDHDMKTSASIMSYNLAHRTRGMRPAPTPAILVPEDIRGLSFNHRALPKLTFKSARDVPAGYSLADIVPLGPMTIDDQPPYKVEVMTDSGETFGSKVSNIVQNRILPSVGGKYNSKTMWQARPSLDGWAAVRVRFPVVVTLVSVGVHSEHSGVYNVADGVRVRARTRDGGTLVAESTLQATDAVVPLVEPTAAQVWDVEFHARNNKETTIRGLRFFTRSGEIFPPPIPAENDLK